MLTFPAGYTAADLDLARAVEGRLGLGEMHVFWTGARSSQERAPCSLAAAPGMIASMLIVVDALMDAVGEMARDAGHARGRSQRAAGAASAFARPSHRG